MEELTQFPGPALVDKLKATLRSAAGAHCGFRATCNPGGAGHNWAKARHIDPGPYDIIAEPFRNPFNGTVIELKRQFIPARRHFGRRSGLSPKTGRFLGGFARSRVLRRPVAKCGSNLAVAAGDRMCPHFIAGGRR